MSLLCYWSRKCNLDAKIRPKFAILRSAGAFVDSDLRACSQLHATFYYAQLKSVCPNNATTVLGISLLRNDCASSVAKTNV